MLLLEQPNDGSSAAKKAKELNLVSKSFGRWGPPGKNADGSEKISHITNSDGELVPVKGKPEPSKEKPKSSDEPSDSSSAADSGGDTPGTKEPDTSNIPQYSGNSSSPDYLDPNNPHGYAGPLPISLTHVPKLESILSKCTIEFLDDNGVFTEDNTLDDTELPAMIAELFDYNTNCQHIIYDNTILKNWNAGGLWFRSEATIVMPQNAQALKDTPVEEWDQEDVDNFHTLVHESLHGAAQFRTSPGTPGVGKTRVHMMRAEEGMVEYLAREISKHILKLKNVKLTPQEYSYREEVNATKIFIDYAGIDIIDRFKNSQSPVDNYREYIKLELQMLEDATQDLQNDRIWIGRSKGSVPFGEILQNIKKSQLAKYKSAKLFMFDPFVNQQMYNIIVGDSELKRYNLAWVGHYLAKNY